MNADIEVVFHFNDNRKLFEGYRPAHLIDGYNLTTGVHHYYKGLICMKEAKRLDMLRF